MIAELERARGLSHNDPRLIRRHGLMALAISFVHTIICLFFFVGHYFIASLPEFIGILAVIWAGNFLLFSIMVTDKALEWRDPSLTVPWTLWLITAFLVTSYFVDAFRISVLMLYFGAILLASFRCNFWKVAALSIFACVGYALVLVLAFADRGMTLSLSVEGLQWLIFSLSCCGFAVTGTGINHLRSRLTDKTELLEKALTQVRDMAIRDELTGLFNRRHIMEILQQQRAIAAEGDYTFSICYLDLDHFKVINDTYGHGAGDQVLRRFSRLLKDSLRDADYTGRLGGEEFVLVLSDTQQEEAFNVCERLRQRLDMMDFSDLDAALHASVSIGIAEFRAGEPIDEALCRADGCLYRAKELGRNKVVTEFSENSASSRSVSHRA